MTDADTVALHRIEVGNMGGSSGKPKITGFTDATTRASLTTAFDYLRARAHELGVDRDLYLYDYHMCGR